MERDMSLPSLEPMIGRVVKVYKGGPESRVGRLLAVHDDHLVLHSEKDGVLYYLLRHIKSIAEDTKEIADGAVAEEVEFMSHDSLEDLLESLLGRNIRLDRGGGESRAGQLLARTYDHIALATKEDGVLYVRLNHIKSISVEENKNENGGENGENAQGNAAEAEQQAVEFFDEDGFDELLDAVKYRWVKINRAGPESIEGVLVDSSGDHLVLVVQQEVMRIPTWHIRNISVASKKAEEKKEENNGQNNNDSSKLSSDDISYIEKMLSEKQKSRGSDRSSDRSSDRGSSRRSGRRSGRGSNRRSGRGSNRGSGHGSNRSSGRGSDRSSNRRSDRRSDRRSRRRSDRRSDRRSNRREKSRNTNRREKKRTSKKKRTKRNSNRLTFFTN